MNLVIFFLSIQILSIQIFFLSETWSKKTVLSFSSENNSPFSLQARKSDIILIRVFTLYKCSSRPWGLSRFFTRVVWLNWLTVFQKIHFQLIKTTNKWVVQSKFIVIHVSLHVVTRYSFKFNHIAYCWSINWANESILFRYNPTTLTFISIVTIANITLFLANTFLCALFRVTCIN